MSEPTRKKSTLKVLLSRGFLALFMSYIFACLSFSCAGSVFVKYGTEYLGLDAVVVGSVAGMVSMIGLVMRPITAVTVDKFNRKGMMVLGYVMLAFSSVMLVFTSSVPGLYAAQIVRGAAWGLQNSAGFIMVGELVDKEDLATGLAVYGMAQVIASSFSAVLILAIAASFGYRTCFWATAAFGLCSMLLAASIPYKSSVNTDETLIEGLKKIRFDNLFSFKCAPILVTTFAFQLASMLIGISWVAKYATAELNIANIGLFATIVNVIMYFTRPLFGRLTDKLGCKFVFVVSCLGFIASLLVVGTAQNILMMYVGAAINGLTCGGAAGLGRVMAMKSMPKDHQAVASSTVGIGNDIGMTAANIIIPMIATSYGSYRVAYYVFAAIMAANLVYGLIYGKIYLSRHPQNEMNW